MLGHTYRRLPATTFARDLVAAGKLGDIHQVRASYLQDWLTDPSVPLAWRLQKHLAGSGALGDIGAHIIDLTQYITGMSARVRLRHARDDHQAASPARERRRASAARAAPSSAT